MALIFIDSGAFVALAEASDRYHRAATETYRRVSADGHKLVTTNHVVDETATWLLRNTRAGHAAAVRLGKSILENAAAVVPDQDCALGRLPKKLFVVYATPDLERLAWQIFEKYDTAGFSFTDCVSFAAMETLGIKQAFAFDKHFDLMGFERL